MLDPALRHVVFVVSFTASMVLLLAISLEILAILSGHVEVFSFSDGRLARLGGDFLAAFAFMLLSGFLLIYMVMYWLLLCEISRVPRLLVSTYIFLLVYIFLRFLIGDGSIGSGDWVLVFGFVCVIVSDLIAGAVEAKFRGE